MAEVQATPVNQLPTGNIPSSNEQDNEIVNEILNEIDNQNMGNNSSMFQRQLDNEINNDKGNMGEPTPEQIMDMNQQMGSIPTTENPTSSLQQEQPISHTQISEENSLKPVSVNSFNLLNYIKETLIVIGLVFIFSLPLFNMLLSKIPKAMSNGSPSMIGNAIKAILAGAIFFVLSKLV